MKAIQPLIDLNNNIDIVDKFSSKNNQNQIIFANPYFLANVDSDTNHIEAASFPRKQSPKEEDIYIFTDGSIRAETFKTTVHKTYKTRNNKRRTISENVRETLNETCGYGIYIQSNQKDIFTYGVVSNLEMKFHRKNSSTAIELKAIDDALFSLSQNFDKEALQSRNIHLYTDNINNLAILNHELRHRNLIKRNGKYVISKYEHKKATDFIEQYKEQHSPETYEQIQRIANFILENRININWVRSHQNFLQNEIVDKLAGHAVEVEKADHFNHTSRNSNVYSNHSFTKIINKNSEQVLPQNDLVVFQQKNGLGRTDEVLNDEECVEYKHLNHCEIRTKFENETFIVKTSFERKHIEQKFEGFENVNKDKIFLDIESQNNKLLSKIYFSNLSSMIKFLNEEEISLENKDISVAVQPFKKKHHKEDATRDLFVNYFSEIDSNFHTIKDKIADVNSFSIFDKVDRVKHPYIEDLKVNHLQTHFLTGQVKENKENTKILNSLNKNQVKLASDFKVLNETLKKIEEQTTSKINPMLEWRRMKNNR